MCRKHTKSELLNFIDLYMSDISYHSLVSKHSLKLSNRRFKMYVHKYRIHGLDGIKFQRKNRSYTKEFQDKIVRKHFKTGYGPTYLANKYNIPSETTVNNWINRYTEGKENKTYSPTSVVYNIMSTKK